MLYKSLKIAGVSIFLLLFLFVVSTRVSSDKWGLAYAQTVRMRLNILPAPSTPTEEEPAVPKEEPRLDEITPFITFGPAAKEEALTAEEKEAEEDKEESPPLFDIGAEPVTEQAGKRRLVLGLTIGGIFVLTAAAYTIYRIRTRKK